MRHAKAGKKLGRDSAHRKALYSNLAGALITHGRIETIGDLTSKSENELVAIPNFGRKSIEEVRAALSTHGLTLKGEELS